MSHVSKISASERCKQYSKGTFHVNKNLLFCSCCNVPVDYSRKDSCDKHLASKLHEKKVCQNENNQSKLIQKGVDELFENKTKQEAHRSKELLKLTGAFCAANIPLSKLDNPALKNYLDTSLKDIGAIPNSNWLRKHYLPKIHDTHKQQITDFLKSVAGVSIVADETTDSEDRYVLNILVVPSAEKTDESCSLNAIFLECVMLETVNFKTVSQAILECINKYGISFDKVTAFVTDNASYMYKAWEKSLKVTFLNGIHVTCNAHLFNLLGEIWQNEFENVNDFVTAVKRAFTACPARKGRFRLFLQERGIKPCLPPVPVQTRWNSWFEAVAYHCKHLENYAIFFETENSSSCVLQKIISYSQDTELKENLKQLEIYAPYISEKLTLFEKQRLSAHRIYDEMSDTANSLLEKSKDCNHVSAKRALISSYEKIQHYFFEGKKDRFYQPAADFFKACRVFDPDQFKYLNLLVDDVFVFSHIPMFEDEEKLKCEFQSYKANVREFHVTNTEDLLDFWKSKSERFPKLHKVAIRCLSVPTNSVDAERSFSKYKNVLQDNRHSIKQENMCMYNMLYQNAVHLNGNLDLEV